MTIPHVVIIGGGFGGLRAAKALRKAHAQITVIDRHNYHLFQPLLYQVATAGLSPAEIAKPIRGILNRQTNTQVIMADVTGIDTKKRQVLTADQRAISYDYLILATGASHSYFGKDEWAPFAPGLKTIEDATAVRHRILQAFEQAETEPDPAKRDALMTFVLVGGGPTGVEMAGSIAELAHRALAKDFRHINPRSSRILLVEAGPRILAWFPESLSDKALEPLLAFGVEVMTNSRVENIDADGVIVNGKRIHSKTVIWTAGVTASPAGKWLGAPLDKAGRVIVQPDLSVPGHPEIFVIGDLVHLEQDGSLLPGIAPVAMQQGKYVGKLIQKKLDHPGSQNAGAFATFRYFDKGSLATIGRSNAVGVVGKLKLSGFIAWAAWLLIHIYYLIGFQNRLMVLIHWGWAYLTFQRGARLITTEKHD